MQKVIIVGGGHAGVEAALSCARLGLQTILISGNLNNIAQLPCNTSIGGPAKGILVREIDALGGQMGRAIDDTYLQIKMLNTAKGPGVQSLRAQADKVKYPKHIQHILKVQENLTLIEDMVIGLDYKVLDNKDAYQVTGVVLSNNAVLHADYVMLTTGTYMNAKVLVGHTAKLEGPDKQKPSLYLSDQLAELGFEMIRLKTGTPPRVHKDSVDYSKTVLQPGDNHFLSFSYDTKEWVPVEKQTPCYLTYTNEETHRIINEHLNDSSMYSGLVEGVGPRYCPSIEDKIVRFRDKDRHQIFLEPESTEMDTIYVQGFSTSMPHEVQEKMIRTIPGLEHCEILKYAYAIEYDAIQPTQLYPSLETKRMKNLYCAGQINGTSGYEEAAAQGLIAGINIYLDSINKKPLVLKRDEAYIGVMIDDLVTKGTKEPYRMLTSRAEYRLLLRHDNADQRLIQYGQQVGLINDKQYQQYLMKIDDIEKTKEILHLTRFTPKHEINHKLSQPLSEGISAYELLKRPEIDYGFLKEFLPEAITLSEDEERQVTIEVKYQGYIDKARRQADKQTSMEAKQIPDSINYDDVANLS